ncbi:effector-binding domain-containing protein [Methylobacterium gossipiicola]|uniref:Effector-binding domain-containing protein n=1 Tax=Methylobacterium gossipiicola TaxID=582675 RepID=A0A1I2WE15_9HYPH|nr:effector-binding domain-containing protein [Methylobacterium gossipiicola]
MEAAILRSAAVTRFRLTLLAGCLAMGGLAPLARAQEAVPPAVANPLPTTTAPAAADPTTPAAPVPAQAGAAPSSVAPSAPRKTLVETPGDANDVDAVSLPAKPAAILAGRAKWEDAVPSLKAAFQRIEADLAKAGITPVGRPIAVFAKTDDDGFQFDAMIPIAAMPDPKPAETDGVHFGTTPSGKALRFPHRGSYDEIDGTYETLTAYLDAKDVVVQDRFIEEYVTDLNDKADEKLDVNIYALPK